MCDGSDNNSRSCGLQYSIRGLNWILQCDLHQDRGHSTCGSNFSPRPWNCINRHFLLWQSTYIIWFVPTLSLQLITPIITSTTSPYWASAVKTLDKTVSLFFYTLLTSHIYMLTCVSCAIISIHPLEAGTLIIKTTMMIDPSVIVIVPVQ